jgi:SET domain-containing protein
VKKSTIPRAGKGLFAAKTFHRNDKIVRYGGEHLTRREINARYPGDTVAQYAVRTREGGYIDARNTNAGVARYANHKTAAQGANAALVSVGRDRVAIEAERRIQPRHEIFVDYGAEFTKAPKRTRRRTRNG